MKPVLKRLAASLMVLLLVFGAFLGWHYQFINISPFWLAGPGILLAQAGLSDGLLVVLLLLAGFGLGTAILFRRRPWWQSSVATGIWASIYCASALWFAIKAPVPLPVTTPYDTSKEQRAEFLEAYESGYRMAMFGCLSTCCFAPEAMTRGHYAGQYDGGVIFRRMRGWPEDEG